MSAHVVRPDRGLRRTALLVVLIAVLSACTAPAPRGTAGATTPAASAPWAASATTPAAAAPTTTASPTATPTPTSATATLDVVGDVNFANASARLLSGSGVDDVRALLAGRNRADLTLANLETAITDRGTPANKAFTFRAPAGALDTVRRMGVDVLGGANNHSGDYGTVGITDTIAAARARHLPLVGLGRDEARAYAPYRTEVNGIRIGILDATQVIDAEYVDSWTATRDHAGVASAKRVDRLVRAVRELRPEVDVLVVFLHWGVELQTCPSEDQRSLARTLAHEDVDAVIGSHAHVPLGDGFLGRTYVGYGLGNFVFSAQSAGTTETGVLRLTLSRSGVRSGRWIPARIRDGVPVKLAGAERATAVAAHDRLRACTGLTAARG